MADKYTIASEQLGQGLNQYAAIDQQKKLQALQQGQKMWEQLHKDFNTYLTQAGNKSFPKSVRTQFYNQAAAIDKQLNPNSGFPAIAEFDDQVGDALDAFGVIDKDETMKPEQKLFLKRQIIAQQAKNQGNLDQTKFLTSLLGDPNKKPVGSSPTPNATVDTSHLTKGQESADRAFGKDYNDYVAQGGANAVAANFQKLEEALKRLETVKKEGSATQLAKRVSSVLPNTVQGVVAPGYKGIEQDIRSNVLGLLRATLGPQFTEKEGERIFSQTFDPSLPPEQNISRVMKLSTALKGQADAKEQAVHYFEKNGTLAGYQGQLPKFAPPSLNESPPSSLPAIGSTFQGGKVLSIKKIK